MTDCIHPRCPNPHNSKPARSCRACRGKLLLGDRYRLVQVLSVSGFSTTYEVDDRGVAKVLKVLNLGKFKTPEAKEKALSLFKREARILSQLDRPGIPRVEPGAYFTLKDASGQDILHGLVMEKIAGVNLEDWIQQRGSPISEPLAIAWLKQLVNLLQELHRRRLFHRDIKPSNIMVQPDGNLALIDFGTVRELSNPNLENNPGTIIISRGYAPPEQERGFAVEQSDFFALGRTLVYALTGQHPLSFYDAYSDRLNWRSAVSNISPQFADAIDRLMAHLPGQRPPNAEAILQELAQIKGVETQSIASPITSPIASPTAGNFVLDRTLEGHEDGVWSVAIGPGNHILVSSSWDKTIKVWNLATGQLLRTLKGHSDVVWSVALSRDGNTLVSGSSDKTIKIWNLPAGKEIATLTGHSSWVAVVALSRDGKIVASGSSDKKVKVWNVATGKLIQTLAGHSYGVTSVAIADDGRTLLSGSGDKTIKIWNLATGELQRTLTGHLAAVTCVAIADDGMSAVSGDVDKTIKIWDLQTGEERKTLSGHLGTVWSVAIAADGRTLVSGSRDKTVKMWDLQTGELLASFSSDRAAVHEVAIAENGEIVVGGGNDAKIKIWRSRGLP